MPMGTEPVSPCTISTFSIGTPSVSATSWEKVVSWPWPWLRSEEHTSELQSLMRISYAVFCLKKKKKNKKSNTTVKSTHNTKHKQIHNKNTTSREYTKNLNTTDRLTT